MHRFFVWETTMITRLKLGLPQDEYNALLSAALSNLRSPADEARYIIRQELQRRGLWGDAQSQTEQPPRTERTTLIAPEGKG